MLKINLLPVKKLRREAKTKQQAFLTVCLAGLSFFICASVNTFNYSTLKAKKEQTRTLKQEKESYAVAISLVKKLEVQQVEIKRQTAVLKDLENSSSLTVRVMDEVATAVDSSRLWLTTLKQAGHSLSISGIALDNRTISNFMNNLLLAPHIHKVDLTETLQEVVAERELKKFFLQCNVSKPTVKEVVEKS